MAGASPRSADLDFADVFGGPPRRSSGNERLSGRGSVDSSSIGSSAPRPWSGEGETPVFGDRGSGDRRRHLGEEFYKDIFPGSDAALPRHAGAGDWGDVFGGPPSPGSTTRPRSSFSMKFSRGAESPMPTTPSRQTSHTNHDGTYADSVQTSPNSQMNSYLAQETPPQDSRKKPFSWRRYPFLSRLRSQSGDKSNASNQVSSMESEAEGTPVDGEGVMANNGFHFSFYKWAGKGALLVLPVTMEEKDAAIIGLKSFPKVIVQDFDLIEDGMSTATGVSKSQTDYEDSKSGKYSTNSGTKEGPVPLLFDDDYTQGMKHGTDYSADSPSANSSRRPSTERSRSRRVKEKVKDFMKIFSPQVSPKRKGAPDVQDQASNAKDKSKIELQDKFTLSSSEASEDVKTAQIDQSTFINVPSPKSERQERTEKPVLTAHTKMEGKVDPTSARNEVAPNAMKEFMKIFSPKGSPKRKVAREVEGQASSAKNEFKTELRDKFNISSSEANEDVKTTQNNQNAFISVPSPLREMQERMEKPVLTVNSKMEGKVDMTSARNEVAPNAVKDFMKIFSPKGSPKRKVTQEVVDQASDAKNESETELRDKFTISSSEVSEDVKTTQNDQNAFINVPSPVSQMQERMEKPVLTVNSKMEGKMYTTSARNEAAPNELISDGRESKLDNTIHHGERYVEDFDGFLVEHISVDPVHNDEEKDQRMIAESKIREWSRGKEGNIRSLLSTLQHVLWPESGWKPIPLVDVIEGAAVKKAYQKALLCLHPDKLQQRGAAMHQKYIAEKVFDILQESWKEFNSVSFG